MDTAAEYEESTMLVNRRSGRVVRASSHRVRRAAARSPRMGPRPEGNDMTTVESQRISREHAEEVRMLAERIKEIRDRRREAKADYEAAEKELAAIRESARLQSDGWAERYDLARSDFYANRSRLSELRKAMDELAPRRAADA